jgi:aspartate/methionine/tyrosine aminotransferase
VYAPLVGKHFQFDLDRLSQLMGERTKLLIVNTPQRPNGMLVEHLEEISALCLERGVTVLSDEIFSRMVYPPETHRTITSVDGVADQSILVDTFSKTYVMTGFRVGWCVAPRDLIDMLDIFQQNSVTNVPAFVQMAALAALRGPQHHVEERTCRLQAKRDRAVAELDLMPGIRCGAPAGSFYVFPDITGTGLTAAELCDLLIDEYSVGVVAGTAFGGRGEGHVRITYAVPDDVLEEGLARIRAAAEDLAEADAPRRPRPRRERSRAKGGVT